MNLFGSSAFLTLQRGLDGASARHTAIANNIANVNTPGYKRQEVSFENELRIALNKSTGLNLARTNQGHFSQQIELLDVNPRFVRNTSQSMRPDENNVDIDLENVGLAANAIYYNSLIQLLNKRITMMKNVVSEGRR